ncbi:hypothetical protein QBC43DRAFT_293045 [Cladorrhinum sp. PSN259]|nr:hypothetical protein QBC43DRAFT_293045 [Cladorrhinum sp. PSN259]
MRGAFQQWNAVPVAARRQHGAAALTPREQKLILYGLLTLEDLPAVSHSSSIIDIANPQSLYSYETYSNLGCNAIDTILHSTSQYILTPISDQLPDVAQRMGMSNPRSVSNAWAIIKKKIRDFDTANKVPSTTTRAAQAPATPVNSNGGRNRRFLSRSLWLRR